MSEFKLDEDIDLSTFSAGETKDFAIGIVDSFQLISLQGIPSSVNNADVEYTLIESNDGSNWSPIIDARGDSNTFTTSNPLDLITLHRRARKLSRFGVRVTVNTAGTTGTVQIFAATLVDKVVPKENRAKYKMLGQVEGTTSPQVIYTVPANVEAVGLCLVVANTANTTREYYFYADNTTGGTYDESTALFWEVGLLKETADKIDGFFPLDVEGATFAVEASAANSITFTLFGKEYYKEEQ